MTRQRPSLRTPQANENLDGFPAFLIDGKRSLWRTVRDKQGPWWFGSSLEGRFDLPAPKGTCYLANDYLGALMEALGPDILPHGMAHASTLRAKHLRELRAPRSLKLANCVVQRAAKWVTAEISTLTPYAVPQQWATAWERAGIQGVRYATRHMTSRRKYSVALFGAAGERRSWPKGRTHPITQEHKDRLRDTCGITIFDTPSEDELVIAMDPV